VKLPIKHVNWCWPWEELVMAVFVKIGNTQELNALQAGKLVEAAGQRIAIFNVVENTGLLWKILGY